MKTTTAEQYRKHLIQVIENIYRNLHRNLGVNELADVACLSPYHFHRIYREMMDIDTLKLAGLPHKGDYMEIGSMFEKLFIHAGSHQLLSNATRSIGLYFDDPKTVKQNELRSMACISVGDDTELDDELQAMEIPAGQCATLLFKGAYVELEKPYDWLFGKWLPESGYEAADFPPFEEYLNDPKTTPPNELLTRIHCLLA